ncbi:uncharacterized protein LOC121728046 [Aricia agestis]|uniref:uncharacterized protein LOC121728046 n=1 Tax=Aricia agestis TaxID=91739 RepID=UPI001C20AB35|nr:uncharacterized protein LOC121728046 [Aricia agestis]
MTADHRRNWKCPKCLTSQRKCGDNSNTPIRQPTNPNGSDDDYSNNVTLRAKGATTHNSPYVTEDRLRDILRQEIGKSLQSTIKDLVSKELTNISQQLTTFQDSLTFFNEYYESFKKDLEDKTVVIKTLQSENDKLKSTVNELSDRLCTLEQNMRESNIEINGIPESKSENLINIFSQLAKVTNYQLQENDVMNITRVAKLNRDSTRPRSVIVKLPSTRHRDAILAAIATHNKKEPKNKLNTYHLGFDGPSTPVFVTEHLSPSNKSLHAATRKKAKELAYKFVWVRGGRIYMRKDEHSQARLIRNFASLNNIS